MNYFLLLETRVTDTSHSYFAKRRRIFLIPLISRPKIVIFPPPNIKPSWGPCGFKCHPGQIYFSWYNCKLSEKVRSRFPLKILVALIEINGSQESGTLFIWPPGLVSTNSTAKDVRWGSVREANVAGSNCDSEQTDTTAVDGSLYNTQTSTRARMVRARQKVALISSKEFECKSPNRPTERLFCIESKGPSTPIIKQSKLPHVTEKKLVSSQEISAGLTRQQAGAIGNRAWLYIFFWLNSVFLTFPKRKEINAPIYLMGYRKRNKFIWFSFMSFVFWDFLIFFFYPGCFRGGPKKLKISSKDISGKWEI